MNTITTKLPANLGKSINGTHGKSAIVIKDLNVFHEKTQILKNINLNIPKHKLTVFLGPSGCGKTTLLKSLNRLTDLHSGMKVTGSITLNGKEILTNGNNLADLRQKMGLLSQRPYPLPMSIFENVAFGLRIQGLKSKVEIAHKVEYHLDQVALWEEVKDRLNAPASKLSIGQQQRLCLARGLAVNPEVILADEPTSSLDPVSSRKVEEQFIKLKDQYTIILVTHTLRQAKRLGDYAVFMYYGEVKEEGPAVKVLETPEEVTTREFLKFG